MVRLISASLDLIWEQRRGTPMVPGEVKICVSSKIINLKSQPPEFRIYPGEGFRAGPISNILVARVEVKDKHSLADAEARILELPEDSLGRDFFDIEELVLCLPKDSPFLSAEAFNLVVYFQEASSIPILQ